jgi:hypothetical protein
MYSRLGLSLTLNCNSIIPSDGMLVPHEIISWHPRAFLSSMLESIANLPSFVICTVIFIFVVRVAFTVIEIRNASATQTGSQAVISPCFPLAFRLTSGCMWCAHVLYAIGRMDLTRFFPLIALLSYREFL